MNHWTSLRLVHRSHDQLIDGMFSNFPCYQVLYCHTVVWALGLALFHKQEQFCRPTLRLDIYWILTTAQQEPRLIPTTINPHQVSPGFVIHKDEGITGVERT